MFRLYILFEHAAGYCLFCVKEFEEVAMFLPQVEASIRDAYKFKSVVKLIAFYPFKSAANALDNINSISEGILHEDLQLFLDSHLPRSDGKIPTQLGVSDVKIGAAITESLNFACINTGVVPEIIRGIRLHFSKFIDGMTSESSSKAQLGLGHSYSRAKVKFNVNRVDNMIIQTISLLDLLDKDINTFNMRIKEWYSYHFPELLKLSTTDNYARLVTFIQNRKNLTEESLEGLEDIVLDREKAEAIFDAAKMSMGMDISPIDLLTVVHFADRIVSLTDYKKRLQAYLKNKMSLIAPNLSTLINDTIAARLISHAGSLSNLAKYPASTVQILGAEKALFRALKTKGNPPKYGLIYHSAFISGATRDNRTKGRISRYLASKCSIASRIDCFSDLQTNVFGEKLRQQVEKRVLFYEKGIVNKQSNVDVMKEAVEEINVTWKKRTKQANKRKASDVFDSSFAAPDDSIDGVGNNQIRDKEIDSKKETAAAAISLFKQAEKKRKLNKALESSTSVTPTKPVGDVTGKQQTSGQKQKKKKKVGKKSVNQRASVLNGK